MVTDTNKDTVKDTAGSQLLSKTFDIFLINKEDNVFRAERFKGQGSKFET